MEKGARTEKHEKLRRLLVDLACMGVIGVVLALIGPFGSFQDPLPLRLIVWLGFAYVGYALYAPIDGLAQRVAPQLDLPVWAVRFVGVMIASIPMSIIVWVLPRLPDRLSWPDAETALTQYLYVAVIGGMITVLFTILQRGKIEQAGQGENASAISSTPAAAQPRFVDRLPPALGTDLLALEMEDHYVRAHTSLGSDLVLMRLGDAMAELENVDGLQIHRSWWVARDAVDAVKRDGRNLRLLLSNGLEAPVSRSRANDLKAAGWL